MSRLLKRKTYLKRLFLPMLLILVTVAVLSIGYYSKSEYDKSILKEIDSRRQYLTILSSTLNNQIESANSFAFFLVNNNEVLESVVKKDISLSGNKKIANILKNYIIASPAEEVFLDFNELGYIVTPYALYPSRDTNITVSVNDEYMYEYIKNISQEIKIENVTITAPYSIRENRLLYTIKFLDRFNMCVAWENIIPQYLNEESSDILLLTDYDNNIISTNYSNEHGVEGLFLEEEQSIITYGNVRYNVIQDESGDYLKLSMLIPAQSFLEYTFSESIPRLMALILIICGVVFLAFLAALYSFQPVKKLFNSVTKTENENISEIQAISSIFDEIRNENEKIKTNIQYNKRAVKNGLMQSLINGQYKDIEALNSAAAIANLSFYGESFIIANVILEKDLSQYSELIEQFKVNNMEEISLFGARLYGEKGFIFFFSSRSETIETNVLDDFYENVFELTEPEVIIGVSSSINSIENASQALYEAKSAAHYNLCPQSNIQYFDNIPSKIDDTNEIYETEIIIFRIQRIIVKRQTQNLIQEVLKLKAHIDESNISEHNLKIISNRIINMCFYAYELYYDYLKESYDVRKLIKAGEDKSVIETLINLCENIRSSYEDKKILKTHKFAEEIKKYINDKGFDYNFSIQKTADHFKVSASTLYKIFNKYEHKTIAEYIKDIRMKKAKELLLKTDLKMANIVSQIGYVSVPSFNNNFKKYTGFSPNQFRQIYKGKEGKRHEIQ